MPNESAPTCGCGIVLDLPKNRTGSKSISSKNSKSKLSSLSRWERKNDARGPAPRPPETGSASSTSEQQRRTEKESGKQGKRLNATRRTRSAERPDSHYTYIDSGSSISSNGIRESPIPEGIYSTIDEPTSLTTTTTTTPATANNANPTNNRTTTGQNHAKPIYAIPSMTSPPPTYDVAVWQSGLPPSYEEYLCHKYAVITRSHTPPPPWSDSTQGNSQQLRRELLASQPDLREYFNHLAQTQARVQALVQAQNNNHTANRQQRTIREPSNPSNQQISREQAIRTQRNRAVSSRSRSESRAQQQRIATMYEDGAFCMETTAIQSAVDNGMALCSLM